MRSRGSCQLEDEPRCTVGRDELESRGSGGSGARRRRGAEGALSLTTPRDFAAFHAQPVFGPKQKHGVRVRRQVPERGARGEGQERQHCVQLRREGTRRGPFTRRARESVITLYIAFEQRGRRLEGARAAERAGRGESPPPEFSVQSQVGFWDWTHFLDAVNRDERVSFSPSLDSFGPSFMAPRPLLVGRLSPRLAPT